MERPFFTTAASARFEALRYLTIAEKLLSTRDLLGAKSFATRARQTDSALSSAEEILAVVETLLAGELRIGNNQPDFYSIIGLTPPQGRDPELVAGQYRILSGLLNPQNNRFPFAEQAFRLAIGAWSVLSNPSRKSLYDREIGLYPHRQPDPVRFPTPAPAPQPNFIFPQPQQQQVHGGESSGSFGRTQFPQAPQVYTQSRAGPVFGGPTPDTQNFTGFNSGSNISFGPKSGSEPVNNLGQQDNYSTYAAGYNVAGSASASVTTHEQLNNNNYSPKGHSNAGDSDVIENAEASVTVEDEENEDRKVEEEEPEEVVVEEGEEPEEVVVEEGEEDDSPANDHGTTFWTACPYCYYMYEYPTVYVDCAMRCQNCRRAIQAVVIPFPPPVVDGEDTYFCCWGFMPMGFNRDIWEKNQLATSEKGYPRSKPSAPRDDVDEDADIFADISSSSESDVDWQDERDRKRKNTARVVRGRQASGLMPSRTLKKVIADKGNNNNADARDSVVSANETSVDMSKVVEVTGPRGGGIKEPNSVAKNFDKLDLNVELSNEAGEVHGILNKGKEPGRKEDDSIDGIGFFDGLDELFNDLPIMKAA